MTRKLQAELLDELPAEDPRAARSRRDLRRVNAWMGNTGSIVRALRSSFQARRPCRVADLGAGDGQFMLRVAGHLAANWPGTVVTLLDRMSLVTPETRLGFARLSWSAEPVQGEVLEWLRQPPTEPIDAFVANLFLHHFSDAQLVEMFRLCAARGQVFIAVEPRRSAWALAFSRWLRFIGCNEVTRHDAPISVCAGFAGQELSRFWPRQGNWLLRERAAGLFSHLFVARRDTAHPHHG